MKGIFVSLLYFFANADLSSGVPSNEISVAFMYMNAIANGLQGLFLFLVYCIGSSEVRKAFKKNLEKRFGFFLAENELKTR